MSASVLFGDCLEVMKTLDADSVDAVITDPPYGLSFMGKDWDHGIPGAPFWIEALRIAKPGAHLVAFGGARTFHRLTCAIEDAGWEIRDCLSWLYGSGFPKSLDVSKAIDKAARGVPQGGSDPSSPNHGRFKAGHPGAGPASRMRQSGVRDERPVAGDAERWQGWGTALKPAWEPIILARKPLSGTVAANVLAHGTGGLNIDGCRIGIDETERAIVDQRSGSSSQQDDGTIYGAGLGQRVGRFTSHPTGRWPATVVLAHHPDCQQTGTKTVKAAGSDVSGEEPSLPAGQNAYGKFNERQAFRAHGNGDGTETVEAWDCHPECAIRLLDEQSGKTTSGAMKREVAAYDGDSVTGLLRGRSGPTNQHGDSGGASRFFYTAKASRSEREAGLGDEFAASDAFRTLATPIKSAQCNTCGSRTKTAGQSEPGPNCGHDNWSWVEDTEMAPPKTRNNHPTVKPLKLMQWLCRLITPPGGLIIDPFAGSGTTGCAAVLEMFRFVGIEQDEQYAEIARARIAHHAAIAEAARAETAPEQAALFGDE